MIMKQRSWILVSLLAIMAMLLAACDTGAGAPATAIPAAGTAVSEAATAVATNVPADAATAVSGAATAVSGVDPAALAALAGEGITPDPTASGKFEFFSWWTAGGEAEGKNDILNLYKQLYPGVDIVEMRAAWAENAELDMVSANGEIYAVPSNVHRGNVLFYNKKVFTDNGITPPTTWDEFFTAAETLKGKGIAAKQGKGDLLVTAQIVLPDGSDAEFDELMRKWREGRPYNPRKDLE